MLASLWMAMVSQREAIRASRLARSAYMTLEAMEGIYAPGIQMLSESLQIDPTNVSRWISLGRAWRGLYARSGDPGHLYASRACLQRVIYLDPLNPLITLDTSSAERITWSPSPTSHGGDNLDA